MTAIETQTHDAGGHEHHDHPPFLAHHWETPQQQFEAGKLGMWLFLATEFLLFGGLFCAYAVYRFNHPELFAYGSQFLDTTWGAINTVVLILSSLTMALAVSAAQLGRQRALVGLLALTFLGGLGFMCIKYIEYRAKFDHNFVWGLGLYEPTDEERHERTAGAGHDQSDAQAAQTHDQTPDQTHAQTPDLTRDQSHAEGQVAAAAPAPEGPVGQEVNGFMLPVSATPPAARGPGGLARAPGEEPDHEGDTAHHEPPMEGAGAVDHGHPHYPDVRGDPRQRPANPHIFFGIYFCMTGLHGVHVLAGMGVIAWLAFRATRGEFGPEYFTPVDLGGLYWHVVDLIWIFLFPLLYLI